MSYVSSGLTPLIVGGGMLVLGSLSVLTAIGGNAIIDTPASNGVDMLASIATSLVGLGVYKSKSTFTALLAAGLAITLTGYVSWAVNTKQAVNVVQAGVNAASAAATAAANSASVGSQQAQQYSGIPAGYRPITASERQWCTDNPSRQSSGCTLGYCNAKPISQGGCGAQGK